MKLYDEVFSFAQPTSIGQQKKASGFFQTVETSSFYPEEGRIVSKWKLFNAKPQKHFEKRIELFEKMKQSAFKRIQTDYLRAT